VFLATLAALAFNPHAIEQYRGAILNPITSSQYWNATVADSPLVWMTPTFGSLLRLIFGFPLTWLQYVPMVGGAIWLALYGVRCRKEWLWARRISLLLLVSVMTAPFGWSFDQVVLIPVVLEVAYLTMAARNSRVTWGLAISYIIINIAAFALNTRVWNFWLLWYAPAMLVWYLLARRWTKNAATTAEPISI
jgi:hypothetical protein